MYITASISRWGPVSIYWSQVWTLYAPTLHFASRSYSSSKDSKHYPNIKHSESEEVTAHESPELITEHLLVQVNVYIWLLILRIEGSYFGP
jgi:hypothetical protein